MTPPTRTFFLRYFLHALAEFVATEGIKLVTYVNVVRQLSQRHLRGIKLSFHFGSPLSVTPVGFQFHSIEVELQLSDNEFFKHRKKL